MLLSPRKGIYKLEMSLFQSLKIFIFTCYFKCPLNFSKTDGCHQVGCWKLNWKHCPTGFQNCGSPTPGKRKTKQKKGSIKLLKVPRRQKCCSGEWRSFILGQTNCSIQFISLKTKRPKENILTAPHCFSVIMYCLQKAFPQIIIQSSLPPCKTVIIIPTLRIRKQGSKTYNWFNQRQVKT